MTPIRRSSWLVAVAALSAAEGMLFGDPGPRPAGPVSIAANFDTSDPKRFQYHQYMTLGRRAYLRGTWADALENYGEAMKLAWRFDPREHFPFEELGDVLVETQQLPEAACSYLDALQILRAQADAANQEIVARIERKLGALPEAARQSPRCLVGRPADAPVDFTAIRKNETEPEELERPAFGERRLEPQIARPPRMTPSRPGAPLLDFDRMELNLFAGGAGFSENFYSDPAGAVGALVHVPAPGLPIDNVGGFAEIVVTGIDRNITPAPPDPSGRIFMLGGGLDYTFYRDSDFLLVGQGGLAYATFGGVTDLDNGFALLAGGMAGVYIDSGVWLTYNPQLAVADSKDWMIFHLFGVNIEF